MMHETSSLGEVLDITAYNAIDFRRYPLDLPGFEWSHPVFTRMYGRSKPELIVDVGSYKGAAAIAMAFECELAAGSPKIICVDQWECDGKCHRYGDPSNTTRFQDCLCLYHQFLSNVIHAGVERIVIPFRATNLDAAEHFMDNDVFPEAVHIDSDYSYESLALDMRMYWRLLPVGGVLFGGNYRPLWPGVVQALEEFCDETRMTLDTADDKWWIVKEA